MCRGRVLGELLEIAQHSGPRGKLLVLARGKLRLVDLVRLEAVKLELLLAERAIGGELNQPLLRVLQLREDVVIPLAKGGQLAELVEHVNLIRWLEEELMIVLTVNVDE